MSTIQSVAKKVVIVGGHGNVSMRLAKLLSQSPAGHTITSIIRDPAQADEIRALSLPPGSVEPLVLSLEDAPASAFSRAFEHAQADVVYFSAGAGGKGGAERTRKIDYEGAVKVFDAIEGVAIGDLNEGPDSAAAAQKQKKKKKPMLVLVSAIDIRDPDKVPAHYNEEDKSISARTRAAIGTYMHWKYEADKDLVRRTAFKWVILRPTGLTNVPGTGCATIGRTHLVPTISRDDVAQTLALLVDREDAAGLAIDLVGGDTPISEGLDEFIKKGETDWLG